MEKSHYQAQGAYFCHTQHGGGTIRANSFKEVFFWFYRRVILENRKREMKKEKKESEVVCIAKNLKDTRRLRWKNSNAAQKLSLWRATRVRQSKVWIPSTNHVIS